MSLETCNHLILDNNTKKIRLTHYTQQKKKLKPTTPEKQYVDTTSKGHPETTYLSLEISGGSAQTAASISISDTSTRKINIRKFPPL